MTALSASKQVLPVQRTWAAGETPSEGELDLNIRDAVNFLLSPPRVSLACGSPQDIQVGPPTFQVFGWDTEIIDTDEMWDSADPTKVHINTPGLYAVRAYLRYPYISPSGVSYGLALGRNTGGQWPSNNYPNRLADDTRSASKDSGRMTSLWISILYPFQAGEYIEVFTAQTTGNSRTPDKLLNGFDVRWVALS